MALRLSGNRFDYMLESERNTDDPTVFLIKELNAMERARVRSFLLGISLGDNPSTDELADVEMRLVEANRKVCDIGLLSAAPVLDYDGTETEMPIGRVLDLIADPEHINELGRAVIRANALSEPERKKSETQPEPGLQD